MRVELRTIALLNDVRNVEVGKRIRSAREWAGMTQLQLATKIGVTPEAVRAWERGSTPANTNRLKAIAKATRVPGGWEFLYRGTEKPPVSADIVDRMERLTVEVDRLNKRIDELEGRNGGGAIADPF